MSKILAKFAMQRRQYAILLALVFSSLPFLDWLALAIMALVTLAKGAREGLLILFCLSLPSLLQNFTGQQFAITFDNLIFSAFFVWFIAILLREGFLWSTLLKISTLFSCLVLVGIHFYFGDVQLQQYWISLFTRNLPILNNLMSVPVTLESMLPSIKLFASIATGVSLALFALSGLTSLFIARGMQASLYNPGGLQRELQTLSLDKYFVSALLLVSLFVVLYAPFYVDLLLIIVLPFVITGLVLVHRLLNKTRNQFIWLTCFYVALLFLSPYMLILLILITIIDSYTNVINMAVGRLSYSRE